MTEAEHHRLRNHHACDKDKKEEEDAVMSHSGASFAAAAGKNGEGKAGKANLNLAYGMTR